MADLVWFCFYRRHAGGGGLPGSRVGSRGASGQPGGQGAPVARVAVIDNYDSFTYNLCQVNASLALGVQHIN